MIRPARSDDGHTIATLLQAYLAEQFPGHTGSSVAALERDVLSGAGGMRILLAEAHGRVVGFVAWNQTYDLHWGKSGALIADLYVIPAHRGLGISIGLVAAVCSQTQLAGGSFLQGMSFDRNSVTGRLYERVAIAFDSAECFCSGRAFRRLAELNGQTPREIVRGLPPKEWNYEP